MHIHRTGKTNERNSTCGALFPAVTLSFGIELARSLALFLSFVRSFFLSFSLFLFFSLSLTLSFLRQISFEQCHMFEGLFCDNLSDSHLLHSIPWPSHRAISTSLGHECKMKGKCMQMKGRRKDMHAHWNENERNMKGKWSEMNTNERIMNGKWQEMNATWREYACKWKEESSPIPQLLRIAQLGLRNSLVGLRN